MERKTNKEFQLEAKEKNKLVTVLGQYVRLKDKILVECNTCHHKYLTYPGAVLKGHGCRKCADKANANKNRLTSEELYKRIYNINSNIQILGEYVNNNTPIQVKCLKCGSIFTIIPANVFIRGLRCPDCDNRHNADTQQSFEKKVYKVNPHIKILSGYKNGESKIQCECLKCGNVWTAEATGLKQGKGCPHCNMSKGERCIESFLLDNKIDFKPQYKFEECKDVNPLPFDFYLPLFNVCIEFDGKQHYEEVANWGNHRLIISNNHDMLKTDFCKQNNIKLIRIPYWDLKNIDEILTKQLLCS